MIDKHNSGRHLPFFRMLLAAVLALAVCAGCGSGKSSQESGQTESVIETAESSLAVESETAESEQQTETETETAAIIETEEEESESGSEDYSLISGVVAIDPGHQGGWVDMSGKEPYAPGSSEMKVKATSGTRGTSTGIYEYELNLDIGLMLRTELESRGYEVIMLREDNDTAISNAERAQKANESGADVTIRLHADGSEDSSVSGATMLIPSSDNKYVGDLHEDSKALGQAILDSYCEATGMKNRGLSLRDDLTGTNWSKIPVALLEMGFMSNKSDDEKMAEDDFREKMVRGIADGIDLYFMDHPTKSQARAGGVSDVDDDTSLEEFLAQLDSEQEASAPGTVQAVIDHIKTAYIEDAQDRGETWAVSMVDLFAGSKADINGDKPVISASVMKVFVMGAAYENLLDPASDKGSGQEGLKDHIEKMITVSSNESANAVVEAIGGGDFSRGMKIVNQFCQDHGYSNTSLGRRFLGSNANGDNYTSANDCAAILTDIYNQNLVSKEASDEMLAYLKAQQKTGKIPAGVASFDAETANKGGELAGDTGHCENDMAIVWGEEYDYVLCVLASDLKSGNQKAIDTIKDISRMAYEDFE